MKFTETPIPGAWIIDLTPYPDERGFFARTYCKREFEEHGIKGDFVQCNIAYNNIRGTLRGMHYDISPDGETKLIRCTSGGIFDVIVDLRTDSPTYLNSFSIELTAENRRALFVPAQCAHGYQTLTDATEVTYQMGAFYQPEFQRGIRYDDPAIGIRWPLPVSVISEKDRSWELL